MTPSQLQLDRYVFKKIYLEAFDAPEPESWVVETQVEVHQHKGDKAVWRVDLTVSLKGEGAAKPYLGEFVVAGFFRVREGLTEIVAQNLVNVNGPAMLYSAVREMAFNLTARGPHRPILLRTVTFIDRKVEAGDEAQKKKKEHETDVKTT